MAFTTRTHRFQESISSTKDSQKVDLRTFRKDNSQTADNNQMFDSISILNKLIIGC